MTPTIQINHQAFARLHGLDPKATDPNLTTEATRVLAVESLAERLYVALINSIVSRTDRSIEAGLTNVLGTAPIIRKHARSLAESYYYQQINDRGGNTSPANSGGESSVPAEQSPAVVTSRKAKKQ